MTSPDKSARDTGACATGNQLSRRGVLKTAAAGALTLAAGPTLLSAMQNPPKAKVLGSGEHTYEVVPTWGALPEAVKYGNCHGVCETGDGRILIHNVSPTGDCVVEFDPDGKFIRSWGKEFGGGSHGMQLRREDGGEFLYFATTTNREVVKTDLKGERVFTIKGYPREAVDATGKELYQPNEKHTAEQRYAPTNTAFHPTDGSFYVTDGYGSNFITQYDKEGKWIRTWGGTGKEDGQLKCPHGIWTDTRDPENPTLLVADRSNVRLCWFTLDGQYIKSVGEELRHPCHFDQRGTDLLIPDLHGRLTIFDRNNRLITHLGDNPDVAKRGNNGVAANELVPGEFCTPHQAIWDRAGNIYVAEWLRIGRVTKLRRV